MKKIMLVIACLGVLSLSAYANEGELNMDADTALYEDVFDETNEGLDELDGSNLHGRRFLGCVHRNRPNLECSRLAHRYGYHHHKPVHDHRYCRSIRHPYACFGWN